MERRSKERIEAIEIYTDGSLKKVGQQMTFGGWGFIVTKDSKEIYRQSGSEYNTTNQRMELTAIQQALHYIHSIRRKSEKVIIYSDSAYVINCYLKEWYINWQHNGWINSSGNDVANKDLWFKIIPYFDNFWYSFVKVDGHSGIYWNEACDELAQSRAEELKKNFRGLIVMRYDDMYEVTREDYRCFINQIKENCRKIETEQIDKTTIGIKVIGAKSGRCLAGRTYDPREGISNRKPEKYYIFSTPSAEESLPPRAQVVLETKEQVQAIINGLAEMRRKANEGNL